MPQTVFCVCLEDIPNNVLDDGKIHFPGQLEVTILNHACGFLQIAEGDIPSTPLDRMCNVLRAVWENAMPFYGSPEFFSLVRPCRYLRAAIANRRLASDANSCTEGVPLGEIALVSDTSSSVTIFQSNTTVTAASGLHLSDNSDSASSSTMGHHSLSSPASSMRKNGVSNEMLIHEHQDQQSSDDIQHSTNTVAEPMQWSQMQHGTGELHTPILSSRSESPQSLHPRIEGDRTEREAVARPFSPTIRRPDWFTLVEKGEAFLHNRTEAEARNYISLCNNFEASIFEGDDGYRSIRELLPGSIADPPENFRGRVRGFISTTGVYNASNSLSDLGKDSMPVCNSKSTVRDSLAIATNSPQA